MKTSCINFCVQPRLYLKLAVALCLALLSPQFATAWPAEAPCTDAIPLDAGESWSAISYEQMAGQVVAVTVEKAGWLAVQAELEGYADQRLGFPTWLELLSPDQRGFGCGGDTLVTTQSGGFLNHMMVRVEDPGTLYMRFGAVSPVEAEGAGSVRLSTRLVSNLSAQVRHKDGEPGDDTEDEDGEILPRQITPDPWPMAFQPESWGGATIGLKDGEPGDDTEDEDGEILPDEPCDGSEPNNDFAPCAMPFDSNGDAQGEIESSQANDHDHFSFSIPSLGLVTISGRSLSGLQATLRDANGLVLAASVSNSLLGGFDLVAVLIPGTYDLRVKGDGSTTGSYALTLQ